VRAGLSGAADARGAPLSDEELAVMRTKAKEEIRFARDEKSG
jgi:hypothetical protein